MSTTQTSIPQFANYINGEWAPVVKTFENRNPANTDEIVGLFAKGSAADIDAAVDAAAAAFPAWSSMPAPARGNILYKAADILEKKFDQLGAEMTREEGKTLPEAKGEVRRAINIFRYFGGEGSRLDGVLVPSERDRVHMFAIRKPIGVVGLITPWNFPSRHPGLETGARADLRQHRGGEARLGAPLSAWRIVEALHEAGMPKGVVNFVAGSGGELGAGAGRGPAAQGHLVHRLLPVGNWLHAEASKRRLRIQLEMGGKNPTIVLADADFNSAVENAVNAAFFSTGQKCTATSRAIVEDGIYDRFVEARGGAYEETQGRRRHAARHRHRALRRSGANWIRCCATSKSAEGSGRAEDAAAAGSPASDYDKGYFVEPTVFADVTPEMTIAREEIFGPVLAVMRARDFEDAMRIANDIPFGLSASIQTTNLSRVFEFVYRMEAGLLTVNLPSAGVEYQLPFGGTKDSSFGPKEQGPAALDFYSDYKTVYLKY